MATRFTESTASKVFDVFNTGVLLLVCAVALYPFIYTFSVSISGYEEIGLGQVIFLPKNLQTDVYSYVFQDNQILKAYYRSIMYTSVYTILTLILCSMAGTVLAEERFSYTRGVSIFLAAMLLFDGGLIPVFLWIRALGMVDTIWAIVLPTAVSPFYIFIFRASIRQYIHQSLKDSVYMDGGGDFLIYTRIVLPLIKPILATIGLFAAVSMWNEFFRPLVYLYDADKMPLTILLRRYLVLGNFGGNINSVIEALDDESSTYLRNGWLGAMKSAIVIVTVVPILAVYPFIQKYFVKGIMIGAIKE
jgi:putative aldouronate transport system permease protein